jgi:nuclear pore complex protein Nup93
LILVSQIREEEVVPSGGSEVLTLAQLQHLMSEEYGETHFNAFEQPVLYAQVYMYTYCFKISTAFL